MTMLTFADAYKAAGFAPGPEIIERRYVAFETLRTRFTAQGAVDLTLLYFGQPVAGGPSWLTDSLSAADPSFSIVEAERELAIFASCLLEAALEDSEPFAGLTLLAASFAGTRAPLARPEVIDRARVELRRMAVAGRGSLPGQPAVEAPARLRDVAPPDDWQKLALGLRQIVEDASNADASMAEQLSEALTVAVNRITDLGEELDMLSWFVGGWSRVLAKPFGSLALPVAVATAAHDLATLTRRLPGPIAAQSLLERTCSVGRKTTGPLTLTQLVTMCPQSARRAMMMGRSPRGRGDVFPVLAALQFAEDVGAETWAAMPARAGAIDADAQISAADMAMQIYRESLLLPRLG